MSDSLNLAGCPCAVELFSVRGFQRVSERRANFGPNLNPRPARDWEVLGEQTDGRRSCADFPPAEGIKELWDDRVRGLSLRVYPSGRATWTFRYRPKSGAGYKRSAVGEYPAVGLAQTREEALKIRGAVSMGRDPQAERAAEKQSIALGSLIDEYMKFEVEPKRKFATGLPYRGYFKNHVPLALKRKKAAQVTRAKLARLHRDFGAGHPASANRLLTALRGVYSWGYRNGNLPTEANPARLIQKFKEEGRERFLSGEELGRLGETLRKAETEGLPWPEYEQKLKRQRKSENQKTVLSEHWVAAIRLLLFTGCRLREILHFLWEEVDFENGFLRLSDSKTGRSQLCSMRRRWRFLQG